MTATDTPFVGNARSSIRLFSTASRCAARPLETLSLRRRYLVRGDITGDLVLTPAGKRRFFDGASTNIYIPVGQWLIAPAHAVANSMHLETWPDGSTTATATVRFAIDPTIAAYIRAGGPRSYGTGLYALRLLRRSTVVTITLPKEFQ